MLDIENQNKSKQMQAAKLKKIPPRIGRAVEGEQPHIYLGALSSATAMMMTPALQISIPPNGISSNKSIEIGLVRDEVGTFVVPEGEQDTSDGDSDRTSICRSPAWDDAEKKRQRKVKQDVKDKRKKEKERLVKEARKVQEPKKRLSKPQPAYKHSRIEILTDKSKSTSPSPIPMATETLTRKCIDQSWKIVSGNETIDMGSYSLEEPPQALNGSRSVASAAQVNKAISQSVDDGFIGGVKLRMSQERDRSTSLVFFQSKNETHPTTPNGTGFPISREERSREVQSNAREPRDTLPAERWSPLSSHPVLSSRPESDGHAASPIMPAEPTSIMNRGIKRGTQDRRVITEYIYPSSNLVSVLDYTPQDHHRQDPPIETYSFCPTTSNQGGSHRAVKPDRASRTNDRPPVSYREPAALATENSRGRGRSGSLVQVERWQSQDSGFEDQNKISSGAASIRSHARGRSWSIASIAGRARRSLSSRPITGNSGRSNASHERLGYDLFQQLTDSSPTVTPATSPELGTSKRSRRASITSTVSSFIGLKNVAKDAFARQSNVQEPLPVDSFAVPGNHKGPRLKKVAKFSKLNSDSHAREQNHDGIPQIASVPIDDTLEICTSSTYLDPTNLPANLASHSHINTPEGEGAATEKDNQANQEISPSLNTYPSREVCSKAIIATRHPEWPSQCQARLAPLTRNTESEERPVNMDPNTIEFRSSRPGSSRAFSFDESVNHQDDEKNTAMPTEVNDNQERLSRTFTKRSAHKFSLLGSLKPKRPKNALGPSTNDDGGKGNMQRNSSKSNSSAPDFGFLPQLRHQSLPQPRKHNDKKPIRGPTPNLVTADDKATRSLIKSPPPSSRSGNSSSSHLPPFAPGGGRSSYTNSSSSSTLHSPRNIRFPDLNSPPTPLSDINPLAKMFVICCSCRYFHDMPSKIYECMTKQDDLVEDKQLGVRGVVIMAVKCPWCGHGMSTVCCEGYVGLVYLRERLH